MNFWRRLLSGNILKKKKTPQPVAEDPDELLESLLQKAREQLHKILLTRKVENGVVKKAKNWTLSKSNHGLFKLENEKVSLMIYTAPFLMQGKDGRIQGLMHLGEMELNDTMLSAKNLNDFLLKMTPPMGSKDQELYFSLLDRQPEQDTTRLPAPLEIKDWHVFDQDQMIARNSTNTLAHLLIHAEPEFVELLGRRLSRRLKLVLIEELRNMLSINKTVYINPHSRQRSLRDYEPAILEFRQNMQKYLLEKKIRTRKE